MSEFEKRDGVLCALGADAAFIGLGLVIASTSSLGALTIGSLRILGAFPILSALLMSFTPSQAAELARQGWRGWGLSCLTATLLGVNIWLFGAAPLWGEADGLAQGYLLLPICLAALDFYRGEHVSRSTAWGMSLAALGIIHILVSAHHFSWVAIFIGVSMALYFDLHKRRGFSLLQRVVSDFALLVPFCGLILALHGNWRAIGEHLPATAALGGLTALAYLCYLKASKALSHTVFGVLSLLEPVGLAAIAVLLYHKPISFIDLALMISGAFLVAI